ncbi:MAG: HAD family hydrolase [Fluviicola sp.]|nr:HAD family hydrolase [Fluviicola sp.]
MKKLVILDFDGTIYKGDSLLHFARFLNPAKYYGSLFLIAFPVLFSKLGLLSAQRLKELFFSMHLRGFSQSELRERGQAFFEANRDRLFSKAVSYIREQQQDSRCMVVSASCSEWLQPFCDSLQLELICTALEYDTAGKSTGNIQGENVKGMEKIRALKQKVDLAEYDSVVAFGNSQEDRILADISQSYHHRFFE